MRLDRFVSQAAGISRSQARSLIRRGRVNVDGEPVRDAARHVGEAERVEHAGEILVAPQPIYLMMNKPCGLLSATSDREQDTVLSLLPPALAARVHLVGRLDKDTSGLLLLTDDGDWSHRVTSPNHSCAKTYLAELAEPLVADAESRLRQGLVLRSEKRPTRPAALQRLDATACADHDHRGALPPGAPNVCRTRKPRTGATSRAYRWHCLWTKRFVPVNGARYRRPSARPYLSAGSVTAGSWRRPETGRKNIA